MPVLAAVAEELALCASNPLSTRDDVAAAIADELGAAVFAVHGVDRDTFRQVDGVLASRPTLVVDDGADLTATIHSRRRDLLGGIAGGTEVTSAGVLRATNILLAGKVLVVVGYGWCGRGLPGGLEGGFTLIELMVVVLTIAILIAIAIATFLGARQRALVATGMARAGRDAPGSPATSA